MVDKIENNKIKTRPHSAEAEEAVLGCMLLNKNAVSKSMQILNENCFYNISHSTIFGVMVNLFEKNQTIDTISVCEELTKINQIDNVGGAYFISGLADRAGTAENVDYYSKIVKEKYILRTIISVASKISTSAYDNQEDVIDILDGAEQELFNLSQDAERGKFKEIEPLLHTVLDNWGNRKSGDLTGTPSGFFELDNLLSGFQKSDFIILAGRPSMGKTALALNLARNAATSKAKVGFFSLEMSNKQLVERLITSEAKLDSHLVRTGKLPKHQWKKLSEAAGVLSDLDLYIDDSADMNIMELRAKARQLKAEKDIDVLFIDYIQLLHAPGKTESRQQEISFISRSLKALAKELDIPVIALSQLSRAVESRTDHRPIMSDLRESGAIEQDADVVLFVYRKYVYSKDEEDLGIGELILSKHRNGPTGLVKVSFIDKYATFDNLDFTHSEYEIPS